MKINQQIRLKILSKGNLSSKILKDRKSSLKINKITEMMLDITEGNISFKITLNSGRGGYTGNRGRG
jgi:uncharacterized membrane-anchored protein YitT (DUF2179 family)